MGNSMMTVGLVGAFYLIFYHLLISLLPITHYVLILTHYLFMPCYNVWFLALFPHFPVLYIDSIKISYHSPYINVISLLV